MLGKIAARLRKWNGEQAAARIGAFASRHQDAALRALCALGFAAVVLLIHREVFSFITQRKQFAAPSIKTTLAPKWSNGQCEEVVLVDAGRRSIFDPQLVERVGQVFEGSPWIRKVNSVERVFPDRLSIKFEYRRPHAAVRRENGFVIVDPEGVRLPGVYAAPPKCDGSIMVTGVASAPPEPGRVWEDDSLKAAVALADGIPSHPVLGRLGIREIDVANFAGRQDPRKSELVLATAGGCQIAWGRAPKTSRYGDLSTEEKIENLREVLAVYPDLAGLKRVSLYFRGSRAVELSDSYVQSPAPQPRPRVR